MSGNPDSELEAAIDRLDRALGMAEGMVARRQAAAGAAADKETEKVQQFAALEARHGELKRAVAQGLRQLDEILAGLPK